MWISNDGRINTVAIPEPTDVMASDFAASSRVVWRRSKRRVRGKWLDALEDDVLVQAMNYGVLSDESDFLGVAPPRELLSGSVASLEDIADAVRAVDRRWQVDVVMALMDYLDS